MKRPIARIRQAIKCVHFQHPDKLALKFGNMMDFGKYRRKLSRKVRRYKSLMGSASSLEDLYRMCLDHISAVTAPIALISQIQRSGGSLLSQLFDGHPEIHAHPHELKIGYPKKYQWPKIDLNKPPTQWFNILFENSVIRHFREGYQKERNSDMTFPFIFIPALQKKIFLHYLDAIETIKLRDVFDAYMTSYFSAWLNNQSIQGQKKYITAFTPRLSMSKENMGSFFEIYPDGRLISIIRDPKNWYPSALRHNRKIKKDKYDDIHRAMNQWKECALSTLENNEKYGYQVCVILFEDLVSKTEPVMRHLAGFLDLEFDPILLKPTFNKIPIGANTSFQLEKSTIMDSTLNRHKTLTPDELEIIRSNTNKTYKLVAEKAITF